jgi:hypothetical protein
MGGLPLPALSLRKILLLITAVFRGDYRFICGKRSFPCSFDANLVAVVTITSSSLKMFGRKNKGEGRHRSPAYANVFERIVITRNKKAESARRTCELLMVL